MILEGKAVVIDQDDVDTDVMYPGRFIGILDDEEMAKHSSRASTRRCATSWSATRSSSPARTSVPGSSRENVPHAMRAAGIRCVIAKSFARIFQRNCINLGLPAIPCPEAVAAARPGSAIRFEVESGAVHVDDQVFQAAPLPPFMVELLGEGGLAPWIRARFGTS